MHHSSLSLGLYIRLVTRHGLDLTRKNFNTTRHPAIFSYIYLLARVTILCYRECRCYCWVAMTGKLATDRITLLRKQQGLLTCLSNFLYALILSVHFDLGNAGCLTLPLISLSLILTLRRLIDFWSEICILVLREIVFLIPEDSFERRQLWF